MEKFIVQSRSPAASAMDSIVKTHLCKELTLHIVKNMSFFST
jgi:hypothetical protein